LRQRVRTLRDELKEFSDDLQAIAYELHPAAFYRQGLRAALEQECALRHRRTGLAVTLDFDPACQSIDVDIATCIYRVVQEGLRNITEHSGATKASIVVKKINSRVLLELEDFGRGFDTSAAGSQGGLGIISMSERVHLVNGTFEIESRPGAGTRIQAVMPIRGEANGTPANSTRR
jgi:signal transduction histidine kinase